MFRTVLIANRGEVAVRIARACRALGLRCVAIFSEADRRQSYLRQFDDALCIGPSPSLGSYLNIDRIIRAARLLDADAVHPGYGFLSENADFAETVQAAGVTFIGPSAAVIRIMGDKIQARRTMAASGIPCLPGSDGALPSDLSEAQKICDAIGYPLIVKAAAGGGGKGMRVIGAAADLAAGIAAASNEAERAFKNGVLYAEKFLENPRHIELQVLADRRGNVVSLGDRDCSVQRRHQKLVEEAPAHGVSRKAVAELGRMCLNACNTMGYEGAGTFEFLYENGNFYFIEMNTRLQVEHTVTEEITGIDIVAEQLRVAAGCALSFTQADVKFSAHAIECRINAEDPEVFVPKPGTVEVWTPPAGIGVRVDSHIQAGDVISPFYDSMLAKIIVCGSDRDDAIRQMEVALSEAQIRGVPSTIDFHARLMASNEFREGKITANFLDRVLSKKHARST
jgi:acetyl-CoA carboxylase, biotin carboxylase subunit